MIALANAPIVQYTVIASLNQLGNGKVTASASDGLVFSMQPDGRFEMRPAGTAGPYEQASQTAQGLLYAPDGVSAYLVPVVVL